MISKDTDKTGGLQQYVEIFVGARVMLRYNVCIEEGLVNGAMGQIVEIQWGNNTRRTQMYEEDIPDVKIDFGPPYGEKIVQPKSVQLNLFTAFSLAPFTKYNRGSPWSSG
jgi:ATP-dependent exoDNAse (exonuclease V) alpha subunit